MIRIDEIYNNVFVAAFQERRHTSVHWFDPFGSVKIDDVCSVPRVDNVGHRLLFWDQEPISEDLIFDFVRDFQWRFDGPLTLITSDKNNDILDAVCDTYNISQDYYFFHGWAALDWFRGYDRCFLYRPWQDRSFTYSFMCPNNIIGGGRSHRVKLFSEIYKRNIVQNNLISFPAICPYDKTSIENICKRLAIDQDFVRCLPRVIDHQRDHANHSHRIDFWHEGCKAFCHVVTETVFSGNRSHLTEKTFKPIVMQQPFVLVAPKGSLNYLRSYGFRTFDSIWDESYDLEVDDDIRISKIADLLQEIDSWSIDQKKHAQRCANDIVMHNHRWFFGEFERILWQELQEMINRC